jgi:ring-1,2-phenylacetyl-CoA epoxidase subunit PaaC
MEARLKELLAQRLLAMADDELVLAHRNSEWTGHAPILEEDIAFASIAQDELGHATIWYGLLQDLTGNDPDQVVFHRQPSEFRNVQMVELPKGDWAFSMLRQFLFDVFEMIRSQQLTTSKYEPVAQAAAKIRQEELYHFRHTSNWVKRLGLGTDESRRRMQAALDTLWPYAHQLFQPGVSEGWLVEAGYMPDPGRMQVEWDSLVISLLSQAGLSLPEFERSKMPRTREAHTLHLADMVAEMQQVARQFSDARW